MSRLLKSKHSLNIALAEDCRETLMAGRWIGPANHPEADCVPDPNRFASAGSFGPRHSRTI